MLEVSREQVAAFRLTRHHLVRRVPRGALVSACGDVAGVQAQVLSAAKLGLRARVRGITAEDVDRALWKDRSLVKTWAMRGALHLLPAGNLLCTLGALQGSALRGLEGWPRRSGLTAAEIEAIVEAMAGALGDRPRTRRELAEVVVDRVGEKARRWIDHSWGGLVRSACLRGLACFGPPRGAETTFVRLGRWVPSARAASSPAGAWLLRRYLASFGPASAGDMARWSGMAVAEVRSIAERLGEEVLAVETEGRPAWILREDARALETARLASPCVNLLPAFDTFLLAHRDKDALVDPAHFKEVYRAAGWISSVLLVDGRVEGTWSQKRLRRGLEVRIAPFRAVPRGVRDAAAAEAEDIGRFLGEDVALRWTATARAR